MYISCMTNQIMAVAEVRRAVANGEARTIREAARVSQSEVAEAVGVSQACVSLWESGDRVPTGQAARNYARLLRKLTAFKNLEELTRGGSRGG